MNDSIDSRYQGEIGQKLGEALLLQFLTLARPEPDPGMDAVGHLRTSGHRVCFNFQFKTGRWRPDGGTVDKWISLLKRESVFLLHITANPCCPQYRFLVLHNWMFHHPDWPRRVQQGTITFNLDEFRTVDDGSENLRVALEAERARVGKEQTLWRAADSPLIPIGELDLFRNFGRLGQIEPPVAVIDEARAELAATLDRDIRQFLQEWWTLPEKQRLEARRLPEIRQWLHAAVAPVPVDAERRERREFSKFVCFMEAALDRLPVLPGFTYDEVSCWRVFVQLFPESVGRLDRASLHVGSCSGDGLMTLSQLSSTFAANNDPTLSESGRRILHRLKAVSTASTLYNYSDYRVIRQIRYTAAEAGLIGASDVVDFMRRHPLEWDLNLNRDYYKDPADGPTIRSNLAKLARPRARDVRTRDISEDFLKRMPKELVDEARRGTKRRRTSKEK